MKTKLFSGFLILSVLLIPMISAADDWPKYRHDLLNSGLSQEFGINSGNVATLALKWKFNSGGTVSASPAVATINGTSMVFIGSWNGYFYALNAVTGQLIWRFSVDRVGPNCTTSSCIIGSSPAVDNGIVYFGAHNAYVYALNAATGSVVWKSQIADPNQNYAVWSSPAVSFGNVYVGLANSGNDAPCVKGHVVALNASTGATAWNFQTLDESSCPGGSGCVGAGVWASPAIDTAVSLLLVGTGNPGSTCSPSTPNASRWPDSILALDPQRGTLLSYFQAIGNDNADLDFGSSPALGIKQSSVSPTDSFWNVIEASKNGRVYTVQICPLLTCSGLVPNSATSYTIDGSEIIGSPVVFSQVTGSCGFGCFLEDYNIYTTTTGGSLSGRHSNGQSIFQMPIAGSYSAPAMISDLVFFGADDNAVHAASINSGSILWSFTTGGSVYSGPAISNSRVYFGSNDGFIYCVSLNGH